MGHLRAEVRFNLKCRLTSILTQMPLHQYRDVIMGVMASQITSLTIACSTVYSGEGKRKHQSSASLAFVGGIDQWPGNSLHKRGKGFHLMTSPCIEWFPVCWKSFFDTISPRYNAVHHNTMMYKTDDGTGAKWIRLLNHSIYIMQLNVAVHSCPTFCSS